MSRDEPPLRIFVALPGTSLGPDATWKDPKDVRSFYDKVAKAVQRRLRRHVELIVEREKTSAGVIHDSMFREAMTADVYLADLTGKNPNVFLELGVRYALRRNVTIPLSQDTNGLPFNVEHVRAVQYANRPDDVAIGKVVDLIESGLKHQQNDSPVLSVLDVVVVERTLWEKVSGSRAETLRLAAERAESPSEQLSLLRDAVESAPRAVDLRMQLAKTLRDASSFTEALDVLREGIRLDPTRAAFFHERGLNLGKLGGQGERHAAVEALREAVRLEPGNEDYLASLGGALRRLAMGEKASSADIDPDLLREARASYEEASRLNRYNTYPALNVVRLQLILARFDEEEEVAALKRLRSLKHLCAFEVAEHPADYWRVFDLADVQLLLGHSDEGNETYRNAVYLISPEKQSSVVSSPLSVLEELVDFAKLETAKIDGLQEAIQLLKSVIRVSHSAL